MNNKGFTLVELLVTLLIVGIIFTVSNYVITNTFSMTNENALEITINNIKSSSKDYIYEFIDNSDWIDNYDNTEYVCISIGNLIEKGYFNDSILNERIKKEYLVKVIRNKINHNIIDSIYREDIIC